MHISAQRPIPGAKLEHFTVVSSLVRMGLRNGDAQFRAQVVRLRDRLVKAGEIKEAEAVNRLLQNDSAPSNLAPSDVEVSRLLVTGEPLTGAAHPPTDRETSAPLADIVLDPASRAIAPIFGGATAEAIEAITAEWLHGARLQSMGLEPARALLLFGPPGTGKTIAAFHIAARLGLPVVSARIDGLVSSFLGTTARNIANLFDFANRYRCILLLDEFDALAKMRDDPHEIGEIKRVVNTLLQNLDARGSVGITIAITNHDGLLDPAVWRRFDNQVEIGLPNAPTRTQMVERFMAPIGIDQDLAQVVAFASAGRTGSQLRTMCEAIKRNLALANETPAPVTIMNALRTLLARQALGDDAVEARLLIGDLAGFVGAALHADDFSVRQEGLAHMLGCSQSTISRWSQDYAARVREAPNAQ